MAAGRFPSGASLALFESLDSTSSEARRRAETSAAGPVWIVALEQTAGYGRRGAAWKQGAGDIAATLLFEPDAGLDRLGQLSFVAALAVADTVKRYAPHAPLALKWPNDVLVDGGKISGILLELLKDGERPLIALGVGVNIVSKPQLQDYPAARLLDWLAGGPPPTPLEFIAELDGAFDQWRSVWRRQGFEPIRSAWLAAASGRGGKIRVRLPNETLEGVFAGLDSSGALIVDCESGRRLISAGTIVRN